MPNTRVFSLEYESEITLRTERQNFKISQRAAKTATFQSFGYLQATTVICPNPSGFSRRYFKVYFAEGFTAQFPIAKREDINPKLNQLIADPAVVCVDLFGERWSTIPGLGTSGIEYNSGDNATIVSGTIQYDSDIFASSIEVNAKLSANPPELFNEAIGCAGTPDSSAICDQVPDRYRSRRIIAIVKNSGIEGSTKSRIIREIPVASPIDLNSCLLGVAAVSNCVGYEGESVIQANNLLVLSNVV